MATVTLLLGIHNHQPDGNFDQVFASGYDDCYARILGALEEAPHVRVALHHTGPLLEWIEWNRPDYLARLRRLVERGQVEILGGAFYEPMLAVIPERDARGQIGVMSDYALRHLGVRPRGMWLAERVWEPGLPATLRGAGVEFTLIDDGHFRYAGVDGPLRGYYVTEKAGEAVAIFPIDQSLRYAIPFHEPKELVRALLGMRDLHPGVEEVVVTYGDDGEKFGMWPGTREWVWDKGWLREFFRLLDEHRAEISTGFFGEVLDRTPPSGRIYLPTASYEEMGEWTLPAPAQRRYLDVRHFLEDGRRLEEARPFVRGGIWPGFLAKYPEANFMHKKMVAVSDKVARAIERAPSHTVENELMRRELYRAQCNCSYWHGLFGGLYLNYLRDAVYRHLLVAEAFADTALGNPAPQWATGAPTGPEAVAAPAVLVEERDMDADLEREVLVQTAALDVVIRPQDGGAVQELGYRPKTFMLTNVLARHEEGYHDKLRAHAAAGAGAGAGGEPKSIHDIVRVKEPGLEKLLVYDRLPRFCFVDRFLLPGTTLAEVETGRGDLGDFAGARYRVERAAAEGVTLVRTGAISIGGRTHAALVEKTFRPGRGGAGLEADYALHLLGDSRGGRPSGPEGGEGGGPTGGPTLDVVFAPELPLTLLDGHSLERHYEVEGRELAEADRYLDSRGAFTEAPAVALVNRANRFRVDLRFGGLLPTVLRFPIETVSNSESGFERTYQGSVLLPLFPLRLGREPVRLHLELSLSDI